MENTLPKLVFVSYGDILYDNGYKTRLMGELSLAAGFDQFEKYLVSFEKKESWDKNHGNLENLKGELAEKNIKLIINPRQNRWQWDFYRDEQKFRQILNEIKFRRGILHGQSIYGTFLSLPYRSRRVKVIFDMHGLVGPEWRAMGKNFIKKWVNQWIERRCLRQADHILTASESLKKLLGQKRKNIACLPCLVNEKSFPGTNQTEIDKLKKKLQLPDNVITVYAGGMQEWQDFSQIIDLVKKNDWHLLVLTNDLEKAQEKFHPIINNCTMLSVPHPEIHRYLALGDWGWLVREKNILNKISFPTKAAEYLICGLPIVHNGTIDDLAGMIKRNDLGADMNHNFSDWVKKYFKNKPEIKKRCRKYARENLTWKTKKTELADIYDQSLRQKISYLITSGFWGGAQKYVVDLAGHFGRNNQVAVITGHPGGKMIRKLHRAGIDTILLENLQREIKPVKDWRTFWELFRWLKKEQPDLMHINSSKAGVLGRLAARLAGVETVFYTAHGWVFNENIGWWQKLFYRIAEVGLSLITDKIFCVSRADVITGIKAGIKPEKLVLIYNGVDPTTFSDQGFPGRKEIFRWRRKKFKIIGNISNFFANKNIMTWLEMVKICRTKRPDWRFVLVGTGPQKDAIEKFIKENNLSDRVCLTGQLNETESIIKHFDVLNLLSKKEGLPYVLLDAINAKVPVVATAVGGVTEIITDDFGQLVKVDDIEGTIEAIDHVLGKKITAELPGKFRLENMLGQYGRYY